MKPSRPLMSDLARTKPSKPIPPVTYVYLDNTPVSYIAELLPPEEPDEKAKRDR